MIKNSDAAPEDEEDISTMEILDDLQVSLRAIGLAGIGIILVVLGLRLHSLHAAQTMFEGVSSEHSGMHSGGVLGGDDGTDETVVPPGESIPPADPETPDVSFTGGMECPKGMPTWLCIIMSIGVLCLIIPALIIAIGWALWEERKKLEQKERECKRKKKKGNWLKRALRRLVCFLVTLVKWITIVVSILIMIVGVALVVACVVGLIMAIVA